MKRTFNILLALTGWFAVITQFILMVENRTTPITEMTVRFFSFFTILTNLLVSVYFSYAVFNTKKIELNKSTKLTGVTAYILVVGLVYQIALRHIWAPTGMQRVVDELLHTLIPSAVLLYWIIYQDKSSVHYNAIPRFLVYPFGYLVFILIRGELSGFYPYPFIDVNVLGWTQTLINIVMLCGVFAVIYFLLYSIARLITKRA